MKASFKSYLAILIVFVLLTSCDKPEIVESDATAVAALNQKIKIEEFKSWFEGKFLTDPSNTLGTKNQLESVRGWAKAHISQNTFGDTVIVVPVTYTGKSQPVTFVFDESTPLENRAFTFDNALLIEEEILISVNSIGVKQVEVVQYASKGKLPHEEINQFTGWKLSYTWAGKAKKAIQISLGTIVNVIDLQTKEEFVSTRTDCELVQFYGSSVECYAGDPGIPNDVLCYVGDNYTTAWVGCTTSGGGASSIIGMEDYYNNYYREIGPGSPISNAFNYLKCLQLNSGTSFYITVNVDQPRANNSAPLNLAAQGSHYVGHAYLQFQSINENVRQNSMVREVSRSIGFYPNGIAIPGTPSAPGIFGSEDDYSGSLETSLTFQVTQSEMNTVINYVTSYANSSYNLKTRNCANMCSDALSQIGINIPNLWQQTDWYSTPGAPINNVKGPSLGAYGEILKIFQHPKLTSKKTSNVQPKPDKGSCN